MTAAAALTYDSLVTDIQVYAERDDSPFIDQIPRLVMMAENRIASSVRGLGMLKFANTSITDGVANYVKPARWRETASFSYVDGTGSRIYLKERGYEYCRTYWPIVAVAGTPKYYANYDFEHFLIVATPDATYEAELCYYERPEPLSSSNQVSWTTQYAPQLLLYGTLLEAQPFLKLPERIAEFRSFYDEAVKNVATESTRRAQDQVQNRTEA
jgi:hypothetical protein